MATSSINEMSSASPRPAKPSPDKLQAQYTNHRERNLRCACLLHSSVKERGKKHAVEKMHCKTASTAFIILCYCGYQNNSHRRDWCLLRQKSIALQV